MPVRVLIVDDSAFIRKALADILRKDSDIQVVGEAKDGDEAIEKFKELRPDVITLDYEMPKKNGIEVIREIMKIKPTPIVMISSYTKEGALITLKCLEEGAIDFISKDIEKGTLEVIRKGKEIIEKVKNAAKARIQVRAKLEPKEVEYIRPRTEDIRLRPEKKIEEKRVYDKTLKKLIVIGASTGGPNTVIDILSTLPPLPAAILVVIHMPPIFTEIYAQRLAERTGFPAKEAQDGDKLEAGKIFVAPGGKHIKVMKGGIIKIINELPDAIYKPSIDLAIESAAEVFRQDTIAVILTGMGNDGAKGIRKVKEFGGKVIAESEKSAIVFGMPRAAAETGLVDYIEDAHRIPGILEKLVIS
ncbi:MAG: chemotaxis response regulator protein-glutamate methylesterase [Candidatus Calescibacterium sp.]|jgi:two-component system chemotaxis response regulator CheB|nr:chemotaxis response regulator protein-glutamate methylesterase [Candidatus Calescibacterium sp.]